MEPEMSPRETETAGFSADAMLRPTEALEGGIVAPPDPARESAASGAAVERLAIHVGNLNLVCAPDAGREVILPPPASRLPHTPGWLLGVANVRGALVPVVDLAMAFGLERVNERRAYLLVSGAGDDAIGLLVDGLPVLQHFDPAERMSSTPPHPPMLDGHVYGAFEHARAVWVDIDIKGLLDTLAGLIAQPSS
jgi:chemotaxis signal transduction protein